MKNATSVERNKANRSPARSACVPRPATPQGGPEEPNFCLTASLSLLYWTPQQVMTLPPAHLITENPVNGLLSKDLLFLLLVGFSVKLQSVRT